MHYINTFGTPVYAKRPLAPDGLKITKMEFQYMLNLGQMHPFNSIYTLPLHRIPKKNSNDSNHVATFKALNGQTKKDNYPILSIDVFTSELHGTTIFSHIDLVKILNLLFGHQIPLALKDIHSKSCYLYILSTL